MNLSGASAGAGSGEFDIYRGCRRRQIIREAFLNREAKEVRLPPLEKNTRLGIEDMLTQLHRNYLYAVTRLHSCSIVL